METSNSTPHTVLPTEAHTHTLIFLHGRGSGASEFCEEFFESQDSDGRYIQQIFPSVKWVFPQSRTRHSVRFDTDECQWFDMWSVERPHVRTDLQHEGIRESIEEITRVIKAESQFVPSTRRIILGGISQGCATALRTLLCQRWRFGAFVGLCGWLPLDEVVTVTATDQLTTNKDRTTTMAADGARLGVQNPRRLSTLQHSDMSMPRTPIFISHSKDDHVVPFSNGLAMMKGLRNLGMSVTWKAYEHGDHWVNEPQGVDDLVEFLNKHLIDELRSCSAIPR